MLLVRLHRCTSCLWFTVHTQQIYLNIHAWDFSYLVNSYSFGYNHKIIGFTDTQEIADQAAAMVKVTYAYISAPIIDIDDAVQKQSIIPNPGIKDHVVGVRIVSTVKQ